MKEQEKIKYGLLLLTTQDRIPTKFVKFIRDGLFELRIEYSGNIYRVFFIFDNGNIVVYCLMVFRKRHRKRLNLR